jgi:hypothetical protein
VHFARRPGVPVRELCGIAGRPFSADLRLIRKQFLQRSGK